MNKFFDTLAKVEHYFAAACLIAISLIVVVAVLFRYVFFNSIPWSEELTKFLMMWMVYFGVAAVSLNGEHLRADLFGTYLSRKAAIWREIIFDALAMVLLAIVTVQAGIFSASIKPVSQISTVLHIPQWLMIASFTLGLGLLVLVHLYRIILLTRNLANSGAKEGEL